MNKHLIGTLMTSAAAVLLTTACLETKKEERVEHEMEQVEEHVDQFEDALEAREDELSEATEAKLERTEEAIEDRLDELESAWTQIERRARRAEYDGDGRYIELKRDIDRRFEKISSRAAPQDAKIDLEAAISALEQKIEEASDLLDEA